MRLFVGLAAALFILASCESNVRERKSLGPDDEADHLSDALVVDFKDGTTKAQFDAWEKDWGIDLELYDSETGVSSAVTVARGVRGLSALLNKIRGHADVEVAEPLMRFRASFVPNDPDYGRQWNLKLVDMPRAWDRSKGKGVVVAVLDTGIAYENYQDFRQVPDLAGTRFVEGYDVVNHDKHANDDHGHGTHVAGTVAQSTHNGEGVAGVAFEASLMPVKVLDSFGSGDSAGIAEGIRWAVDHGARVLNLSLGGGGRSEVLEKAVNDARKIGAVVVCAAGNGGREVVEYPAAYEGAVAVTAVGPSGERAPYSSFGKEADLAAPGGDKRGGDEGGVLQNTIDPKDVSASVYSSFQGTSMATPHVAGAAAILFAAGAKSPADVERALYEGAKARPNASGWSKEYGHGVLNVGRSLDILLGSNAEAETEVTTASARPAGLPWQGPALGVGLLALVLMTLRRRDRNGLLNVLLAPRFLVPFVVVSAGAIAVAAASAPSVAMPIVPIPDWSGWLFGRGRLANPVVFSALVPVFLSMFAVGRSGWRPVVAGVSIGFASFLGYAALSGAPPLSWMPFAFMAVPWLVLNAMICLFLARGLLKKDA